MNPKLVLAYTIGGVTAALIGAILGWTVLKKSAPDEASYAGRLDQPRLLTLDAVKDHNDADFGRDQLQGHWSIMFFGFTHCPDICPTTLRELNGAVEKLQADGFADIPQIYMASVDPKRDQPAALKQYITSFNPQFIGLTGSEEAMATLARSIGATYVLDPQTDGQNYSVNHTAAVFVLDKKGQLIGYMNTPHSAEGLAEQFKLIVQAEPE